MNALKKLLSPTRLVAWLMLTLLPALAQAHPGHGLGPVGHDLQHAAWNFLGMVMLAALMLALPKLPVAAVKKAVMKVFQRDGRGRQ